MSEVELTREEQVSEFRQKSEQTNWSDPDPKSKEERGDQLFELLREEYVEFHNALEEYLYYPRVSKSREDLIKEWADVQYILSQFAVFFEFDADEAFRRVHESNMSKFPKNGDPVRRREDGKILKPLTYFEPNLKGL